MFYRNLNTLSVAAMCHSDTTMSHAHVMWLPLQAEAEPEAPPVQSPPPSKPEVLEPAAPLQVADATSKPEDPPLANPAHQSSQPASGSTKATAAAPALLPGSIPPRPPAPKAAGIQPMPEAPPSRTGSLMPQESRTSRASSFGEDRPLLSRLPATSSEADMAHHADALPGQVVGPNGAGADTAVGGDVGAGPLGAPPPANTRNVRFGAGQAVSDTSARDEAQGKDVKIASGDDVCGIKGHAVTTAAKVAEVGSRAGGAAVAAADEEGQGVWGSIKGFLGRMTRVGGHAGSVWALAST